MKNKALFPLLLLTLLILTAGFYGCENTTDPTPTPNTTEGIKTDLPKSEEPTDTEPTAAPTTQKPTLSPEPTKTPDITWDPRFDSPDTVGPFTFGESVYKIYLGEDSTVIFNLDKTVYASLGAIAVNDRELFALTASFIDLNFDEIPDFSYFESGGRRICYLANAEGVYTYQSALSNLYKLSRCYETAELYATITESSDEYYSYTFVDGKLVQGEAISDKFLWDIRTVADALAGEDAPIEEGETVYIRGIPCRSYTVGGYISVATDSYGNFYIKDMPHRGFCRLSLNPNGRWSKSEKVTEDAL
ncbi:MAG: hypothetical protein E7675_06855 [Ruminococcaceae bacterium]|nr:hypothetical protein [Oscillospiraceae bacterium]